MLLSFSFLILLVSSSASQARKPVMVFAVSGEAGEGSMDAVVIVDGRQLRVPFTDEQKDRQKKIAADNSVHAEVGLSASARLGGPVRALATSSDSLGKRASARRAPSDAERAAVMTLVKSIYRQNSTPANLISDLKVTNLTATDLDGDGKYEFIGSFTSAAKNKFERDLFLIAKPQGAAMRADLAKFQAYQPPPETFLHSIDFIDHLDLDGNGVGEVFAVQGAFDGYSYLIFKKIGGRWREVYNTIGDLC